MSKYNRRDFFRMGGASILGLGMRSAITGLPIPFLLNGDASASSNQQRIAILASSSQGEPLNVCGPGTFDTSYSQYFTHPNVSDIDLEELIPQEVNGILLGVEALSEASEVSLGGAPVQMASCFAALDSQLLQHLSWFNYRSGANIHPQYKDVLTCYGRIRGEDGRGSEQLPAAIAQEIADALATTLTTPLVLGEGAFLSKGSSLANYSPTKLKTLAQSVGQAMGGTDNFAVMYDAFIDEAYLEVRNSGTAQQRRFFDQHAISRQEAVDFGSALGQMLEDINDDSIQSQLRCAAIVAKLRLAPVVLTNMACGGDNHQDAGLLRETNQTLEMVAALDVYWKSIHDMGIADEVVFANLDVFGRDPESDGNGRSHFGDFVSGMILGTNIQGGVVGGWEVDNKARATGINSSTGSSVNPDILAKDTLPAYFKTIMNAAGVSLERQEVRLPTGQNIASVAS